MEMDTNAKRWLSVLLVCSIFLIFYCTVTSIRTTNGVYKTGILNHEVPHFMDKWKNTNRSLTVITAFFDIGKFPKGAMSNVRNERTYEQWANIFRYIQNPLVVYTDTQHFKDFFTKLRANYSASTKIIHISRENLWPFQIIPKIKKIYSKPGYPRHYPNTYIPEYTSLTHSKQPVLAMAAEKNYFQTDYFCWFDVGYFRDIVGRHKKFWLEVPSDFDKTKIGVTRVYNVDLDNITPGAIIKGNRNWIGGGLFLGVAEKIQKFHKQYKEAVLRYLDMGLMNVEQHILYAMYTKKERERHPLEVDVQLYIPGRTRVINTNPWFYLGYVMYNENMT